VKSNYVHGRYITLLIDVSLVITTKILKFITSQKWFGFLAHPVVTLCANKLLYQRLITFHKREADTVLTDNREWVSDRVSLIRLERFIKICIIASVLSGTVNIYANQAKNI